jgi:orotidine-5'-phosphate decarboxylase
MTAKTNPIFVALDTPDLARATDIARTVAPFVGGLKVGLEFITANGPEGVRQIVALGVPVFADVKFHDIPNTVAGAVRSAAVRGVRMMTVHALGGPAMLSAARDALAGAANPPELLAVTVLTSMDGAQLNAVGLVDRAPEQVERLAKVGLAAGIRGFVCSPQEVGLLRGLAGPDALLVIPGIRPAGAGVGDQRRVATPAEALRQGASYLVVGRPITQAPDPAEAADRILKEMAAGLREARV